MSFELLPLEDPHSEIRLLRLLPGDDGEDIRGIVTTGTLESSERPDYVCISYTWGDLTSKSTIYLTQESGSGSASDFLPTPVTRNCWSALHQVRRQKLSDYYWIDLICIDQCASTEKNQQVQMMGQIYSSALATAACVGDGDAIELLSRHNHSSSMTAFASVEHERDTLAAMSQLAEHRYWSRVWILQELFLAQESYLLQGKDCIPLRVVSGIFWQYELVRTQIGGTKFNQVLRSLDKFGRRNGVFVGRPLLEIIREFGGNNCAQPFDKVYGLRSLATPEDQRRIVVDYDAHPLSLCASLTHCIAGDMRLEYVWHSFDKVAHYLGLTAATLQSTESSEILEFKCIGLANAQISRLFHIPTTLTTSIPLSEGHCIMRCGIHRRGQRFRYAMDSLYLVCDAVSLTIQGIALPPKDEREVIYTSDWSMDGKSTKFVREDYSPLEYGRNYVDRGCEISINGADLVKLILAYDDDEALLRCRPRGRIRVDADVAIQNIVR